MNQKILQDFKDKYYSIDGQFLVELAKNDCIAWVRSYFEENASEDNIAVVGLSGGKDSTVTAALCVEALGSSRVLGVLMPNGYQEDLIYATHVAQALRIQSITVNISDPVFDLYKIFENANYNHVSPFGYNIRFKAVGTEVSNLVAPAKFELNNLAKNNISIRMRMIVLYAIAQSVGGRVANTSNLSEDWVGYATRYGDGAGDFAPIANFTVTEVKQLGKSLGLSSQLINKIPVDGVCGLTDEENLGFTYEELDNWIRFGVQSENQQLINSKHLYSLFKMSMMPKFGGDPFN